MKRALNSKVELYPTRFKRATLTFSEPSAYGIYTFSIYKPHISSLKKKVEVSGGRIVYDDNNSLRILFEGTGALLKVHQIATSFMFK